MVVEKLPVPGFAGEDRTGEDVGRGRWEEMTGWDSRTSELHNTPNGNDSLAMVLHWLLVK